MKELIAFVLPPATALVGMRLGRWMAGAKYETRFGLGFRFALGLAIGMFVFAQAVLFGVLAGVNLARPLAWTALIWGAVELVLLARQSPLLMKAFRFQIGHLWLLILLPMFYSWWVFGRLSTLEGTLEFDANAFWVFKAKILYLEQGKNFTDVMRQSDLCYTHTDYPWLVPGIYALDYGAVGGVDEFVNKVWPFWMMVALSLGVLSYACFWRKPRALPLVVVTVIAFLPATLEFIRNEGGTIPMVFYTCILGLLLVRIVSKKNPSALAITLPVVAGCAMIKFEGVLFGFFCLLAVLPLWFKSGWWKDRNIWNSGVATAVCLLPYVWYRFTKPVPYIEANWWHAIFAAPGLVLMYYPKALFLCICGRFFNTSFFHWHLSDNIHLQFDGHWLGLDSFVNEQISVLPWLLVIVLGISLWKKRELRAVLALTAATVGILLVLPFVICCISYIRSATPGVPDFSFGFPFCDNLCMGRYFYPFFTAWFLGIAAAWFAHEEDVPPAPAPEKKNQRASSARAMPRR